MYVCMYVVMAYMCVCVCMYVCVCVYVSVCTCVCVPGCVARYVPECFCVWVCSWECVCLGVYILVDVLWKAPSQAKSLWIVSGSVHGCRADTDIGAGGR